jgi:hypothetical protein
MRNFMHAGHATAGEKEPAVSMAAGNAYPDPSSCWENLSIPVFILISRLGRRFFLRFEPDEDFCLRHNQKNSLIPDS